MDGSIDIDIYISFFEMLHYFPLVYINICKERTLASRVILCYDIPDLCDPPDDSLSMELSCIDVNSTLKLTTLLSPFQVPSRYSHLLVNLRGKVFTVK